MSIDGYAEDYAYLVWGLLELFQTSGDPAWLDWAVDLQARQDELFWDDEGGGWFATTGRNPSVLLRIREEYDGAEPAASSVAVENLLTLMHLRHDPDAAAKVEKTLGRFGTRLGQAARAVPLMMAALVRHHAPATQIVIVGQPRAAETRALERVVAARYLPFAVRLRVTPGEGQARLAERLPFVGALREIAGRPAAYVCSNFTCREPVTDPERLDEQLERSPATMTFNVEVLLKGKEDVVEIEVDFEGPEPAAWADDDVRRVLELTLGAFDQVQNPDADERSVALRGFSWIVRPVDGGVGIFIEIPSGAVVAGPFEGDRRHAHRHHHACPRQRAGQLPTQLIAGGAHPRRCSALRPRRIAAVAGGPLPGRVVIAASPGA